MPNHPPKSPPAAPTPGTPAPGTPTPGTPTPETGGTTGGTTAGATAKGPGIPAGVWALGLVSMLMDLSSEMIHSVLPVFMVSVLGMSALTVGIVEGIAEATASIVKIFSGALSDRMGKRKPLALLGYGLAAVSKPLFPLASSVGLVLTARFMDRVGKGIRGAPRDALVADLTPASHHGAAYGLRQTLDTIGAVAGPLAAVALMAATMNDYVTVFQVAVIPAVLSVTVLAMLVKEPPGPSHGAKRAYRHPWRLKHLRLLSGAFWRMVAVAALMTLARFSEAFLILRGGDVGLSPALAPMTLVVMNLVYAVSSYPVGVLSDRLGRRGLLLVGFAALVAADLVLALAGTVGGATAAFLGAAFWGLHMGMTQGLLSAAVADLAPRRMVGTAFGIFHLSVGVATLGASALAGLLWALVGAEATFLAGGGLALTAMAALWLWRGRLPV